jgi:hypothetical protein
MPLKSKNVIPNTVSVISPEAYVLDYIQLINHISPESDPIDIQGIVTEFSITESIYSPGLIFSCSIKDSVNLIETYKLNGQEIIRVSMQRKEPSGNYQSVKLEFYVSEYPLYAKSDQHTQVYKISGISPHVFISDLKNVSRPIKGKTTADEIKKILNVDLMSDVSVKGNAISKVTGVITKQKPLEAVSWLLTKTFDDKFTPFFFYQTLADSGKMYLRSYQDMISSEVYNIYENKKLTISESGREESTFNRKYYEQKNTILSMDSKYNVSKIFPAKVGAYASEAVFIDLGKKKITNKKYEYKKPPEGTSLNGNETLKLDWAYSVYTDETRPLTKTTDAFQVFLNTNSLNPTSYAMLDNGIQFGTRISILENMEYMTHELSLYGDFSLSSGSVIQINVIKSGDTKVIRNSEKGSSPSEIYDSVLSGKYIVTGISHVFGEDYYCRIRIKKDSPLFSLSKK